MRKVAQDVTVSPRLPDEVYVVNAAAGAEVTLPPATGSGFRYTFIVGTTVTSNANVIQVANSDDIMQGVVIGAADTDDSVNGWEAASDSDTITMDGSTTGGIVGDRVELVDVAENVWAVNGTIQQTGTEATPFSAAV
jgi:fructose-specific component phosphotransferase system IIB-like protein